MWNVTRSMSDKGEPSRDWRFYIADMVEFGENVVSFTDGMDRDTFIDDARTYHAVVRNLALIGEAATHVPPAVQGAYPEIEWRRIIGTRNRLAHAYLHIDNNVLWDIIRTDVPRLLPQLRQLLEASKREGE